MKPRERRLLRFVQAFRVTRDNAVPSTSDDKHDARIMCVNLCSAEVGAGIGIRNEEKVRHLLSSLTHRGQITAGTTDDIIAGGTSGGGGGGGGEQN